MKVRIHLRAPVLITCITDCKVTNTDPKRYTQGSFLKKYKYKHSTHHTEKVSTDVTTHGRAGRGLIFLPTFPM